MAALTDRLQRYSEACVAERLDADFASAVREAVKYIPELENTSQKLLLANVALSMSKPRWISVKDRLPDFEGSLLCMRKVAPDLSFQEVLYFEDGEFTYNGVDQLEEGTVTYWMPLIEPPKDGET